MMRGSTVSSGLVLSFVDRPERASTLLLPARRRHPEALSGGPAMCLVGDSIDLQFYHAVGHGLRWVARVLNVTVDVTRVPVN